MSENKHFKVEKADGLYWVITLTPEASTFMKRRGFEEIEGGFPFHSREEIKELQRDLQTNR